jgi:putative ATPase
MPEGQLTLAHATIALALAPKSNSVTLAIGRARGDIDAGRIGIVPTHLRDAHYPGARDLGHGTGYRYAHDAPYGVAAQQYLPDELKDASYYEPSDHGAEASASQRWERLQQLLRDESGGPGRR